MTRVEAWELLVAISGVLGLIIGHVTVGHRKCREERCEECYGEDWDDGRSDADRSGGEDPGSALAERPGCGAQNDETVPGRLGPGDAGSGRNGHGPDGMAGDPLPAWDGPGPGDVLYGYLHGPVPEFDSEWAARVHERFCDPSDDTGQWIAELDERWASLS